MRIVSFIGLRFLRSPRQTRSISVITWISGVGIMLGVMALIVSISVMNGFRENLFLAVTGTMAHVRIVPQQGVFSASQATKLEQRLAKVETVVATAPYLSHQAFLRVGDDYRAVILRGIDPAREGRVTELPRFLHDRVLRGFDEEPPASSQAADVLAALRYPPPVGERSGIVLGLPLARGLGLRVGDELDVVSTEQRVTPIGPIPLIKRFQLVGVFETGIGGTDEVTAYVDYRIAQKLFRMGDGVSGVAVRVSAPNDIDETALRAVAPGDKLLIWNEENKNIFQVMKLEKLGVFLILILIIVVSFFNIISSLIMLVLEKRKAIAVLKSLGAGSGLVRRIFFMQGVWIGAVGTFTGLGLGLAACWALETFNLVPLPPGVFPLARRLPVLIEWSDLALITGSSFLICLLVTLYPATRAARTDPVRNLRIE